MLGHTKCGAVTAACSGEKMPSSNLQAMVDQIESAVMKVKQSATGDALIEAAVKENVHQSALHVVVMFGDATVTKSTTVNLANRKQN